MSAPAHPTVGLKAIPRAEDYPTPPQSPLLTCSTGDYGGSAPDTQSSAPEHAAAVIALHTATDALKRKRDADDDEEEVDDTIEDFSDDGDDVQCVACGDEDHPCSDADRRVVVEQLGRALSDRLNLHGYQVVCGNATRRLVSAGTWTAAHPVYPYAPNMDAAASYVSRTERDMWSHVLAALYRPLAEAHCKRALPAALSRARLNVPVARRALSHILSLNRVMREVATMNANGENNA